MLNQILSGSSIKGIVSTSTFRQSLITFSGIIANGALGAVFYILAARTLGPEGFGIITVSISVLTLLSGISDLGTNTGLVRFVGKYFKSKPKRAMRFIKLGLEVKFAVSALVLILGWRAMPAVATHLFSRPELTLPLKIALIGVSSTLLFSFITSSLQGLQKFWLWSGIQVGTNLLRVVFLLLVWLAFSITVETTLLIYVGVLFLGFLAGVLFLPRGSLKVDKEFTVKREFFNYNKWVAAFIFIAAFSSRMDTFISARLLPIAQVGIYGVALQIVYIVPQIVSALSTVIAPKMASMGDISDIVSYLKKTQVLVFGLAGLGILAIPLVLFLIPILFGASYISAGSLFIVLLLGQLVYLISVPVHLSVFYYFSYPKLFLYVSLGHLAVTGAGGWYLISAFGAMGAAMTVLFGSIFNLVVPLVWVLNKIKKSE